MSSLPDGPLERGLREKLLGRTRGEIERLRRAADAGDFATIVHLAHRLAGAAGALRLDALSEAGRALERAGAMADAASVRAQVDAVAAELARTQTS